jgi:hypothetical protein
MSTTEDFRKQPTLPKSPVDPKGSPTPKFDAALVELRRTLLRQYLLSKGAPLRLDVGPRLKRSARPKS